MAFASAASHRPAIAEINVTPLVDVMLVLLIIFMVTAPLLDHRLALALPQNPPRTTPEPTVLALTVEPGGLLSLDGRVLSPRDLEAELARRQADTPDLVLRIEVAADADYQAATTAMALADRAGVSNIALQ